MEVLYCLECPLNLSPQIMIEENDDTWWHTPFNNPGMKNEKNGSSIFESPKKNGNVVHSPHNFNKKNKNKIKEPYGLKIKKSTDQKLKTKKPGSENKK